MVVSNEPGYYEEGAFGIRIENLVAAREAETPFKFGDVPYLSFERLTQVPFQRKLMDLQVRPCNTPSLPRDHSIIFAPTSCPNSHPGSKLDAHGWAARLLTDQHFSCPCCPVLARMRADEVVL